MMQQYLTRFNKLKDGDYARADSYVALWDHARHVGGNLDEPSYHIASYMYGAIEQMKKFDKEPTAWGFGLYTTAQGTLNEADYWLETKTLLLPFHAKDRAKKRQELHEAAEKLGYAHVIFDTISSKGEPTVSIIVPLTEAINAKQYARLVTVLGFELGHWRAAKGYSAMTHLVHVDQNCVVESYDGAILAPKAKIKETAKMYQNIDKDYFCAAGPRAIPHLVEPTFTSHDGLFEWTPTETEKAIQTADQLLATIGVKLN
ncbi:hypothetical protein AX777_05785 [Sphingobium yanoikuyae]|uniref:Uncharacterized protein n=1 Tax=Sphingobium yanoikuyae TaxID=13690 RepID=A0A177JPB5_SPHYA|nr:hypothetical protein [Sphingobium yanoikuyae]OAH42747.1 hypothetical protein AX777_05785 [Sphingobium yanoikuyae]